jgi:hypothetical protein
MITTNEQFRASLVDPDFGVAFIIGNNPEDIGDNIRGMGVVCSTPNDIVQALNGFLEAGQGELFVQALNVPVRMDRLSPEQLVIVAEQAQAISNVAGKPLAKSAEGGFNVNALFAGLATGYLTFLNASGTAQVNPNAAAGAAAPPAPKKDNTMAIVLGGIALVVVILIVVAVVKAKK